MLYCVFYEDSPAGIAGLLVYLRLSYAHQSKHNNNNDADDQTARTISTATTTGAAVIAVKGLHVMGVTGTTFAEI